MSKELIETLEGHVALVTGASSGLGRASALRLSAAGAAVVCADLKASAHETGYDADIDVGTVDLIRRNGGDACFVKADVRNAEDVQNAVSTAVKGFGRLDILVNCAGVYQGMKRIVDNTEDHFDFEMDINAKGTWLGCKYSIEQMMKQSPLSESARGRIVNFTSIAGLSGQPFASMYCQSKASVIGLTRALAVEWGKEGITVNAIAPGTIPTAATRVGTEDPETLQRLQQATPVGRFGEHCDVARAVHFLAADEAGFITGHTLSIDGGMAAL